MVRLLQITKLTRLKLHMVLLLLGLCIGWTLEEVLSMGVCTRNTNFFKWN